MEITVEPDYESLSLAAARMVAAEIRQKPALVLGLATGETPVGLYRELVRMYRAKEVDFSLVTTFNLDEYCDLPADHPQTFTVFMHKHLFNLVNIPHQNINLLNSAAPDYAAECRRYDDAIRRAGGIDVQILGIGLNGHVGLNEPDVDFGMETRVTKLAPATRRVHRQGFPVGVEVPRRGMTLGLRAIMNSRKLVLLASGSAKAGPLRTMIKGPVSPKVPISILTLHPHLTVIADTAAAGNL